MKAKFGGRVLLKKIESKMTQNSHVLSRIARADARVIFTESNIKHPTRRVFDAPMVTDSTEDRSSLRRQTGNEKALFALNFAIDVTMRFNQSKRLNGRPFILV